MAKLCCFLLPLLAGVNMFYNSLVSNPEPLPEKVGTVDIQLNRDTTQHHPRFTMYGGDIFYLDECRLYTESGEVDSTFATEIDMSLFLEDYSAEVYRKAVQWEIYNALSNYSSVLIYEDGEVMVNLCNPYNDECIDIYLNVKDCDEYGSCLYWHED